jgi:hypothetical protein
MWSVCRLSVSDKTILWFSTIFGFILVVISILGMIQIPELIPFTRIALIVIGCIYLLYAIHYSVINSSHLYPDLTSFFLMVVLVIIVMLFPVVPWLTNKPNSFVYSLLFLIPLIIGLMQIYIGINELYFTSEDILPVHNNNVPPVPVGVYV